MDKTTHIVVFPTIFSKNKIPLLIANIKKILKIKDLKFNSVKRDGDIILVDANDPVFASSAINLLFGIKKIAIAKKIKNNFQEIVSEISSTGGNLLLKDELFFVKVDGSSKGFVLKDVEMAATSQIIDQRSNMGARPGTLVNHDKLLYCYLTKNNAYICIFSDDGKGGIPLNEQKEKTVCTIYDELSAISCYETIKQGYDVIVIVCYRQKSELLNLAKIINQIIPRLLQSKVDLEFFHVKTKSTGTKGHLIYLNSILEIMLKHQSSRVSLALSPMIFPANYIDGISKKVYDTNKIPIIALAGADSAIFNTAKELGLSSYKISNIAPINIKEIPVQSVPTMPGKKITIKVGPNNVHDILDVLDH